MSETQKPIVKDFPLDTSASNLSEIKLTSRYPEEGYVLNTVSEMTVYILDGSVSFNTETESKVLDKGSVLLLKINQPYFWQPLGEVTLLIFSAPSWTPDQQRHL